MKFNNGAEFIDKFNSLPKDVSIKNISHGGSITQYLSETFLQGFESDYIGNQIETIRIVLKQDGSIKKIKYKASNKIEILFATEKD